MAIGVCPIGLQEAAVVTLATATTYYSTGVTPSDTQEAMGWIAVWTPDGSSAPTVVDVVITPQIGASTAAAGTPGNWSDLPDAQNLTSTAAETLRDWIRGLVPAKVRLKIQVRNIDNSGGTLQVYWLGTAALTEN